MSLLLGTGCQLTLFVSGMEKWTWTSWWTPRPSKSTGVQLGKLLSFEHEVLFLHFPNGSDVSLLLRTFCEHRESFGHFDNWFWCVFIIEDPFCWGRVYLGYHFRHPTSGFVAILSSGVWVCVPFVRLVFLFPFAKWEIQIQFIRKILSVEPMTKTKIIF